MGTDRRLLSAGSTSTNLTTPVRVSGQLLVLVLRVAADAAGDLHVDVEVIHSELADDGLSAGAISTDNAVWRPDDVDLPDYASIDVRRGGSRPRPMETSARGNRAPVATGLVSAVRRRVGRSATAAVRSPVVRRLVVVALIGGLVPAAGLLSPQSRGGAVTSTSTASGLLPRSPDVGAPRLDLTVPCGTPASLAAVASQSQGFLLVAMPCP
jgi:hypothetical protein